MHAFSYHRPATLDEALKLARAANDPKFLSGGQTLIPTMKQRLAAPSDVIDLGRIAALKGISASGAVLRIGAGVTHAEIAVSAEVKKAIPALAHLAEGIGDQAVRHRGTLGGSVANADPAADYPSAVVALNAEIETTGGRHKGETFFKGLFETALQPGEIVTALHFAVPERAAYAKFPNPASRYAMTGVFVAKLGKSVRVAVTGAGPCVFRATALESALEKSFTPAALDGLSIPSEGLNSDLHGSAEYRAHLTLVMAKRAVAAALG